MHDHHGLDHEHRHAHCHAHEHEHEHDSSGHHHVCGPALVLRPYTGISGDIMVAGLARVLDADQPLLDSLIAAIGLPELAGALAVTPHSLNGVGGWQCAVSLPHEHAHRTLADIRAIIAASALTDRARELAIRAFALIAEAEGGVHGKPAETVTFHEVGALDSILDICLAAALFDRLNPGVLVCGPLPVCDGSVRCEHGALPAPAPAVMRLLPGIPVRGLPSEGETLTPTGVALLKAFGAIFGPWPAMTVTREALIYGTRVFPGVPNGAIFALGDPA